MNLAKNLQFLIKSKGMTIMSLSRKTGISPQTLHNWISRTELRSIKQLKKVALILKVSVDDLAFSGTDQLHKIVSNDDNEITLRVIFILKKKAPKNRG